MKRKYLAFLFIVAILLSGCGNKNSVSASDGYIKIGSIIFDTRGTVKTTEKIDDTSYVFTLAGDAKYTGYVSVVCTDVSQFDKDIGSDFAQMQQETWLAGYPERFNETNIESLHFGSIQIPAVSYGTINKDGSTRYNLTGSFYYEGFAYTLTYFTFSEKTDATEKYVAFLANSAYVTTGELPGKVNSPKETDPVETKDALSYVSGSYILNTNTKKFHHDWCSSAKKINASNKSNFTGSRSEIIAKGYEPCNNCNP